MRLATAFVEVRPDTKNFKADLKASTESDARDVGKILGQALAGGAFLAGAKRATDAASQLEQAVGGTAAVFGASADGVEDWAKRADTAAGLSERAARELTSQIGGLLKGFGFTNDEAADLSITLATLGADLAATFGGKPEEAVQALGAALRGETDPLERFGIALNQTLVNQKAVELGLAESTSAVDQNAKAQATLALITERSADAQGQFAREADTAAGQAAISAAKVENSAADLGQNLLPIYTKISEVVGTVADVFGSLPEPVQTGVIALAGVAALSGPVTVAASAIGSLATIARSQLTRGLDAAAGGAYDLAGGLRGVDTNSLSTKARLVGMLGTVALLVEGTRLLNDRFSSLNKADLSQLENSLLDLAEAGSLGGEGADILGDDLGKLAQAIERVADPSVLSQTQNAIDDIANLGGVLGSDSSPLNQATQRIDDLDKALASLAGRNPEAAAAVLEAILADLPAGADQLPDLLNDYNATLADVDTAQRTAGDSAGELAPKIKAVGDELTPTERAAKDAADSVDLFRKAVERALQPLDFEAAVDARSQALADLARGVDERTRAVEQASARLAELQAAEGDARDPAAIAEAERALQEAIDLTSLSLEGNSEAALRNREELRDLIDDSLGVIESAREQGRSLDDLQLIRAGEVESLKTQLRQLGYNEAEIEDYIDVIEAIPLTKATTVTADTSRAEARIKALLDIIESVPLSIDAAVADRNLQRTQSPRKFAAGGTVMDGEFEVHDGEVLRKRGSSVEVLAGSPSRLAGGAVINVQILNPTAEPASTSLDKAARRITEEIGTR